MLLPFGCLGWKDEDGDRITMGDQEDLDMAIAMCRDLAAKENVDMGKLEVSDSQSARVDIT